MTLCFSENSGRMDMTLTHVKRVTVRHWYDEYAGTRLCYVVEHQNTDRMTILPCAQYTLVKAERVEYEIL